MINTEKLEKLFEKQAEKGFKKLWVLFEYLNTTPINDIRQKDKAMLMNIFNIGEEYLDDKIEEIALEKENYYKKKNFTGNLDKIFAKGIDSKKFNRELNEIEYPF